MKRKKNSVKANDKSEKVSKRVARMTQEQREQMFFEAGTVYNILRDPSTPDDWKELLRKRAATIKTKW